MFGCHVFIFKLNILIEKFYRYFWNIHLKLLNRFITNIFSEYNIGNSSKVLIIASRYNWWLLVINYLDPKICSVTNRESIRKKLETVAVYKLSLHAFLCSGLVSSGWSFYLQYSLFCCPPSWMHGKLVSCAWKFCQLSQKANISFSLFP